MYCVYKNINDDVLFYIVHLIDPTYGVEHIIYPPSISNHLRFLSRKKNVSREVITLEQKISQVFFLFICLCRVFLNTIYMFHICLLYVYRYTFGVYITHILFHAKDDGLHFIDYLFLKPQNTCDRLKNCTTILIKSFLK